MPKDLLPKSTRYDYFALWTYDGTSEDTHHALYVKCREQIGREVSPTAAIIDSDPSTSLSNHWFEVISAGFLVVHGGCLVSTVLAKMSSFLTQAIRASLWGLPAVFRRAYNATKAGFGRRRQRGFSGRGHPSIRHSNVLRTLEPLAHSARRQYGGFLLSPPKGRLPLSSSSFDAIRMSDYLACQAASANCFLTSRALALSLTRSLWARATRRAFWVFRQHSAFCGKQ